jgi:hypothetical protein
LFPLLIYWDFISYDKFCLEIGFRKSKYGYSIDWLKYWLQIPFTGNHIFYCFISCLCVSEMSFLWTANSWIFKKIHSAGLHLTIRELRPCTLSVVIEACVSFYPLFILEFCFLSEWSLVLPNLICLYFYWDLSFPKLCDYVYHPKLYILKTE